MRAPLALVRHEAAAGAETLWVEAGGHYDCAPPALHGFRPVDARRGREFLAVVSRPSVACADEAVMLFRDAVVLDGSYILARDGSAVAGSFYNVAPDGAVAGRLPGLLARVAAGEAVRLGAGPPVVALFAQDCNNFGHLLIEMLPRLLHLAAAGVREMRLLFPDAAAPLRGVVEFALAALGLEAELVACPVDSILFVPALHWVSLVGQGHVKSPTVRRLMERLRAAAGPAMRHERLFVARAAVGRRGVANAAEVADIAAAMGFHVVAPEHLPFAGQVALFAGARAVAGAMGAGLTLSGAMSAGGRVAMFEAGNCDFFYWDLACLAGLGFDWAFTAPVERFDREMVYRPMTIPPMLLRRVLRDLGGAPPAPPRAVAAGNPFQPVRQDGFGGEVLIEVPAARYGSAPPALVAWRGEGGANTRRFLATLARPEVECPAETVRLLRDVVVLDGRQIVRGDGSALAESFADVRLNPERLARLRRQHGALGEAPAMPGGVPVVAVFKESSNSFGHVLVEMLPRLEHIAALGLRRIRLLLPADARKLVPVIEYALGVLGIAAEIIECAEGSAWLVPVLHWVSPVARHNDRKSPTVLRLLHRLRDSVRPAAARRLFIVRPPGAIRSLGNDAAVRDAAVAGGFTPVEPGALPFAEQLALFAGAAAVAGPWGAGLTLGALMAPGRPVGMLDPGSGDLFFWDLACLGGQRFHWAFTEALPERLPPETLWRDTSMAPWVVRRLLRGMEG